MESDTGIGLTAAAQRISELEQLVDSLSKKIEARIFILINILSYKQCAGISWH
jgi:hypothetical protein